MQGQQVQAQLQVVTFVQHGFGHGLGGIGAVGAAQPVGFVVRHVVAALVLEGQVDEAFEHAVQLVGREHRSRRTAEGVLAYQGIEALNVHVAAGEPELHLDLIGAQRCERALGAVEAQGGLQVVA